MTKPPNINDILSGRSGVAGGRNSEWTGNVRLGPMGLEIDNLSVESDADQARLTSMLERVTAQLLPSGPPPPAAIAPSAPEPRLDKTEDNGFILFAAALENWGQTLPAKTPSKQKTKRAKIKSVEDLVEFLGTLPPPKRPVWVRDISRIHCSNCEIWLLKRLDRRTVENKFGYIEQWLEWAQASGYFPQGTLPTEGLARVPKKDKAAANAANGAQKFLPEQLALIFDPAHYAALPQEADRWLPLICLHTGARGNEIARLELADIYVDDHGVPVFDISLVGDNKSVKVAASERKTPIHPDLVALGLLERVDRLKAEGEKKLFPALTFGAQNGPANAPMTAFIRYLDLREISARGTGSVGMHSFRDTVLSKLKAARVQREVREEYTGHAVANKPEHASAYEDPFSTISLAKTCHPVLTFGLNIGELRKLLR